MTKRPQNNVNCGAQPTLVADGTKPTALSKPWQFLDLCSDGIAILEHDSWNIVHVNRSLQSWLERDGKPACQDAKSFVSEADLPRLTEAVEAATNGSPQSAAIEILLVTSVQKIPVQLHVGTAESGGRRYAVLVCRKSLPTGSQQEPPAREDPLTGLPDRNHLIVQLHHWLNQARDGRLTFAVLFIDLNNFKEVNDTRGHMVGDFVLGELARRLAACMRSEDLIARFGGDEFVVLVASVRSEEECRPIVERIQQAMRRPIPLVDGDAVISASIGLVVADENTASVDTLLQAADQAMYAAKRG